MIFHHTSSPSFFLLLLSFLAVTSVVASTSSDAEGREVLCRARHPVVVVKEQLMRRREQQQQQSSSLPASSAAYFDASVALPGLTHSTVTVRLSKDPIPMTLPSSDKNQKKPDQSLQCYLPYYEKGENSDVVLGNRTRLRQDLMGAYENGGVRAALEQQLGSCYHDASRSLEWCPDSHVKETIGGGKNFGRKTNEKGELNEETSSSSLFVVSRSIHVDISADEGDDAVVASILYDGQKGTSCPAGSAVVRPHLNYTTLVEIRCLGTHKNSGGGGGGGTTSAADWRWEVTMPPHIAKLEEFDRNRKGNDLMFDEEVDDDGEDDDDDDDNQQRRRRRDNKNNVIEREKRYREYVEQLQTMPESLAKEKECRLKIVFYTTKLCPLESVVAAACTKPTVCTPTEDGGRG